MIRNARIANLVRPALRDVIVHLLGNDHGKSYLTGLSVNLSFGVDPEFVFPSTVITGSSLFGGNMLIRLTAALAITGASVLAVPSAAIAAAASASGTCSGLATSYDQVEKSLAMTYAEGVGDNSAPRETNRQMENANDMSRASMILTLMQAHHCAMPDHAPSFATYISAALSCATDRMKGVSDAPSCKMDNWQPIK